MCLAGSRPVSERVPKPSQGTRELLHQLKLVFEHQGRENSEFVVHKITTLKCLLNSDPFSPARVIVEPCLGFL